MIAYIILAHSNPLHLDKLVDELAYNESVFVNIDSHNLTQYSDLCLKHQVPNFHAGDWGGFGTIKAILNLLENAVKKDVTHIVLLTGSDYPIVPPDYISDFFDANKDTSFMSCKKLPWAEGNKLANRIPKDFNVVFPNMTPHCGYAYWAITKEAALYLLNVHNPKWNQYIHSNITMPIEFYFQTLLANSGMKLDCHLTYYKHLTGAHSPETLTGEDYVNALLNNAHTDAYGSHICLYARKFDDKSTFID